MTDNNNGFLGIQTWVDKELKRHYGARGTGQIYKEFYTWLNQTSYKCTSVDFPWDYFIFTNLEDENLIKAKYGQYIYNS